MSLKNNKALGQHWLKDPAILEEIANYAELQKDETVLEIGPGLGTLTSRLLKRARRVVAVELDRALAENLPKQFPGKDLVVVNEDILKFDLTTLPTGYKVVANIPYYLTSLIIQKLLTNSHQPQLIVLLVQKEVAERLVAIKQKHSLLSISVQVRAEVELGVVVPASLFTPPPKVDSQVVILRPRSQSLIAELDEERFFRLVRAGFSKKRQKIKTSLATGLGLSKDTIIKALLESGINPDCRAENLTISDWKKIYQLLVL